MLLLTSYCESFCVDLQSKPLGGTGLYIRLHCFNIHLYWLLLVNQAMHLKVFKLNNSDTHSMQCGTISTLNRSRTCDAMGYRKRVRTRQDSHLAPLWFHSLLLVVAGLPTNILIVFTLTGTWGAAEQRPALPLLQSWDHSDRGGLISWPDLHPLLASFPPW